MGNWCSKLHQEKRHNKLDDETIKRLELLVGWFWGSDMIKTRKGFDEEYDELKAWIAKNDRLPSQAGKTKEEIHLGRWCSSRRRDKKIID